MHIDDSLWKAILEDVFDDFLRFVFPDADDLFDMGKEFEYLDKELAQLFPPDQDEYKPRYVDKLVKVHTIPEDEEWVLVHIEVQGYGDNLFSKRMFQYYYRIFDKFDKPITAIAVFTDAEPTYHPNGFVQSLLGTKLTYSYNTFKVLAQSEEELMASDNPFAMVVLIVKTALKGKKHGDVALLDLKLDLVRHLMGKRMPKPKIRSLMNFLRYYIRFENNEMIDNFEKEVAVITQKSTTMGIEEFLLDRAEKKGIQKGIEKGRKTGVLEEKWNTAKRLKQMGMSNDIIAQITGMTNDEILKF